VPVVACMPSPTVEWRNVLSGGFIYQLVIS
jgi:hypothetical protein